jgi:Ser-tRNA(Ala) deacylase AlaX
MVIKQYLISPATSGTVEITQLLRGEPGIIQLRKTWFHPQGGGQKADRGTIGTARVLHVAHNGEEIDHLVDSPNGLQAGGVYPFEIDRSWRALNMVYHTAGHLLAGLVETLHPELAAVAGHHWPGEARVEFAGNLAKEGIDPECLNRHLAALIDQNLAVAITGNPLSNRAIKIGDFKDIPCGGVHTTSLSQILWIRVKGLKRKGDRLRLAYEAMPQPDG